MDPASILAIIGGVCMVVKGGIETYETWSSYQKRKKTGAVEESVKIEEEKLSQELKTGPSKIQEQYNQLVSALGSGFARNGDAIIQQDFKNLRVKQRTLIKYLQNIRNTPAEPSTKNIHEIRNYAGDIQADLSKALLSFAQRTTSTRVLNSLLERTKSTDTPLDRGKWPRKFCYGALLLQSNDDFDDTSLASDATLYILGFICKFCHLEVGDYRMSKRGKTIISTRLLAASHVLSCPSFTDRRAAYKCLPCHARHFDIDFPSAAALEQHLKKHPNSRQVREMEEVDVVEKLNLNAKALGFEEEEEDEEHEEKQSVVQKEPHPREAPLNSRDSAASSSQARTASFATTAKTTMISDSVSISAVETHEQPMSNSPWNTGPVLFDGDHPNAISELESPEEVAPPPPQQRSTPKPPSTSPPPPLPGRSEQPKPHQQTRDVPSRHQTPNPYQQAQGYPPQQSSYYPEPPPSQNQPQSYGQPAPGPRYQSPPPPENYNYPPPSGRTYTMTSGYPDQASYDPQQASSRAMSMKSNYDPRMSTENARYPQAMNETPSPSMNNMDQGYHLQKSQRDSRERNERRYVEPEREERSFFGVKKKKNR